MRHVLWWLIDGSHGGRNRLQIIRALDDMSMNANQLSNEPDFNYKTTQHHLELLVKNNVSITMGDDCGKTCFLVNQVGANLDILDEVARKVDLDDMMIEGDDA